MPKFNHTKGKAARTFKQRRDIQETDKSLTAAQDEDMPTALVKLLDLAKGTEKNGK